MQAVAISVSNPVPASFVMLWELQGRLLVPEDKIVSAIATMDFAERLIPDGRKPTHEHFTHVMDQNPRV